MSFRPMLMAAGCSWLFGCGGSTGNASITHQEPVAAPTVVSSVTFVPSPDAAAMGAPTSTVVPDLLTLGMVADRWWTPVPAANHPGSGTMAFVSFSHDGMRGFDGCNWFGGPVGIESGSLVLGEMESTASGCLAGRETRPWNGPIALDADTGQLSLTTNAGVATFAPMQPTDEADLTGHRISLLEWEVWFSAESLVMSDLCGPVGTWSAGPPPSVTLEIPESCPLTTSRATEIFDGTPLGIALVDGSDGVVLLRPAGGDPWLAVLLEPPPPPVIGLTSDGTLVRFDADRCTVVIERSPEVEVSMRPACDDAADPALVPVRVIHDVVVTYDPVGYGMWVWDLRPGHEGAAVARWEGPLDGAVQWFPGGAPESPGDDVIWLPSDVADPLIEVTWDGESSASVHVGERTWVWEEPGTRLAGYRDHRVLPDGTVVLVAGYEVGEHFEEAIVLCRTECLRLHDLDHLDRFVALGEWSAFVLGEFDAQLTEVPYR